MLCTSTDLTLSCCNRMFTCVWTFLWACFHVHHHTCCSESRAATVLCVGEASASEWHNYSPVLCVPAPWAQQSACGLHQISRSKSSGGKGRSPERYCAHQACSGAWCCDLGHSDVPAWTPHPWAIPQMCAASLISYGLRTKSDQGSWWWHDKGVFH